jgi:hypothetical protein
MQVKPVLEITDKRARHFLNSAVAVLLATGLFGGSSLAASMPSPRAAVTTTIDQATTPPIIHPVFWRGHQYCWATGGWRGPGWYWCGYSDRRGVGWGGPTGWRGLSDDGQIRKASHSRNLRPGGGADRK